MNTFDNLNDQTFHSVIGRNVVDEGGEHIGTLDALWTDEESGKVEFLGVKTGWIFGKTHVVPARGAEIHDDQDQIRVPYSIDKVKAAPSYPAHEELTNAQESEIYSYYGVSAGGYATGTGVAGATGATSGRTVVEPTGIGGVAGSTGARAPIGETTEVSGVREQPMPGDRARTETRLAADQRNVTEPVELTTEEERLKVGTRQVEAGRVRLRKIVRTEEVNVPVELRKEDVVVERVPADQVRAGARSDFTEGEVEMTMQREEAIVGKERVVTGAVRARKTEEVEHQTVSDTVRKEDVEVDRGGLTEAGRETVTGHDVTGTTGTTGTTGSTGTRRLDTDPESGRTL
jgi:uncharacterized protein (TIGR02271 family)